MLINVKLNSGENLKEKIKKRVGGLKSFPK